MFNSVMFTSFHVIFAGDVTIKMHTSSLHHHINGCVIMTLKSAMEGAWKVQYSMEVLWKMLECSMEIPIRKYMKSTKPDT